MTNTWGVLGSSVMTVLQIFSGFWLWKKLENWLIFDSYKAYKNCAIFWATLYIYVFYLDYD